MSWFNWLIVFLVVLVTVAYDLHFKKIEDYLRNIEDLLKKIKDKE